MTVAPVSAAILKSISCFVTLGVSAMMLTLLAAGLTPGQWSWLTKDQLCSVATNPPALGFRRTPGYNDRTGESGDLAAGPGHRLAVVATAVGDEARQRLGWEKTGNT